MSNEDFKMVKNYNQLKSVFLRTYLELEKYSQPKICKNCPSVQLRIDGRVLANFGMTIIFQVRKVNQMRSPDLDFRLKIRIFDLEGLRCFEIKKNF